jgi:hypothetical protein
MPFFWFAILRFIALFIGSIRTVVCAVGVYVWRQWPEACQAGFVFVLFGTDDQDRHRVTNVQDI